MVLDFFIFIFVPWGGNKTIFLTPLKSESLDARGAATINLNENTHCSFIYRPRVDIFYLK